MNNRNFANRESLPATVSAIAVAAAGAVALIGYDFGPQSTHMALHIAAMNIAAPLTAALLVKRLPGWIERHRVLWLSAATQLLLLWAWHAPAVQNAAAGSHTYHGAAYTTLFLSSFAFWSAILRLQESSAWQAIAALLLTGKLACLLSALLIFSPRALYNMPVHHLDDQQLAGLLMITACPLSYLIAAVLLASRLINGLAQGSARASFKSG